MKKIKKLLLGMLLFAFLFTTNSFAQEEEEFKSMFLTATTSHWSSDSDVDFSDWLETEKEYFDKVTMKNDLIVASGYYTHFYTPDNSEIVLVSVFRTWEDIEKSNDVTAKLVEEGWPDEEARKAFLEKQNSYYSPNHADEIYATLPFTKEVQSDSDKPLIYYVRKNQSGSGGSGFEEFHENVTLKNSFIKGYYTHRHLWGSNSRDAIEVFVYDALGDIEKSVDERDRLIKEHWPDEAKRKEFFEGYSKIFDGHGDFIYTNVPELNK
jgi:hypothetical protein